MLRRQDVVLLPSITDEQPRLIYDCFSQAVPVIASDTTGIRECVTDSVNGKLVPAGNSEALADAIAWASTHRDSLRDLGIASQAVARDLTHDKMHERRAVAIQSALTEKYARRSPSPPHGLEKIPLGTSSILRSDPLDPSPTE